MARIGIDFGTTYTSAFYWQDGRYNSLLTAQEHQSPLVPSLALLYKNELPLQYGFEARRTLINPLLEKNISRVFRGFKMLLGKMATDKMLRSRGFDVGNGHSPENVTEEFLCHYLKNALSRCPGGKIEKLVVGIPQIWFDEVSSTTARDSLRDILHKLKNEDDFNGKIEDVEFEPEPALACAYYVDFYRKNQKVDFNGHMLLIDYGGGTLDINLCKINNRGKKCEISIIARTGKGINDVEQNTVGKAGLAFLENAVKRATGDAIEHSNATRHNLEQSLESKLMSGKNEFEKKIRRALSPMDKNTLCSQEFAELDDGKTSVTYGTLLGAYNEVIKPTLTEALFEIKEKMDNLGINAEKVHQQDDFKIVLAGGFSNFYLTQKQVYDYFDIINPEDDPRLRGVNAGGAGLEYAIAYGAALVAAEVIQIKPTYPYSFGIAQSNGKDKWLAWTIGEDSLFNDKPRYVRIKDSTYPAVFIGSIIPKLFYDPNGDGKYVLVEPLPIFKESFTLDIKAYYKIGFSLDRVLHITLWLQKVCPDSHQDINTPIEIKLPDLFSIFGHISEVRKEERRAAKCSNG